MPDMPVMHGYKMPTLFDMVRLGRTMHDTLVPTNPYKSKVHCIRRHPMNISTKYKLDESSMSNKQHANIIFLYSMEYLFKKYKPFARYSLILTDQIDVAFEQYKTLWTFEQYTKQIKERERKTGDNNYIKKTYIMIMSIYLVPAL